MTCSLVLVKFAWVETASEQWMVKSWYLYLADYRVLCFIVLINQDFMGYLFLRFWSVAQWRWKSISQAMKRTAGRGNWKDISVPSRFWTLLIWQMIGPSRALQRVLELGSPTHPWMRLWSWNSVMNYQIQRVISTEMEEAKLPKSRRRPISCHSCWRLLIPSYWQANNFKGTYTNSIRIIMDEDHGWTSIILQPSGREY